MSSPITQWTETVREAVMRARHGDNYAEIMPADNPDDKADLAAKAITSATIELIEGLIPKEKIDRFFGLSLYEGDDTGLDTPHLTEREEGYNQALAELRQSLKELRQ